MAKYKEQGKDLVFALDIGTRSVVGVVGTPVDGKLKLLAIDSEEHTKRAMIDGQIDDIQQVAKLVRIVTKRLEEALGVHLTHVSVAAAGRALRTQKGAFALVLPDEETIDEETISRLEAGAVSKAEEALQESEENWKQMFLVGYTVAQYRLDNYPLTALQGHSGKLAEVDVVATFLPGEVVESLYATMRQAGLQVLSTTLEPIAAMNAAIPPELRLLNLALVDIGAGTTDIAICREGSVVGYTMATIAGDEITEALMRAFLIDFQTAESVKRQLKVGQEVKYKDILGMENSIPYDQVMTVVQEPADRLAEAIAKQIMELNLRAPSAIFLAGGGSKLCSLRERVAKKLKMEERRVALAGNNFSKSAFSDKIDLDNPELATPLGIAVSAGLGLLNDSYRISLNGKSAKLFRSGVLTMRDILLMNGYTYGDMIGRSGKNLTVTLDGKRCFFRGEPSTPAILMVNGVDTSINAMVHAGDQIQFTPARGGQDAQITLQELLGENYRGPALVNNQEIPMDMPLRNGDVVLTLRKIGDIPISTQEAMTNPEPGAIPERQQRPGRASAPPAKAEESNEPEQLSIRVARDWKIELNGKALSLPPKENDAPYYLMDLLEYSGIDFDNVTSPVRLEVNGKESGFQQLLAQNDRVVITCDEGKKRPKRAEDGTPPEEREPSQEEAL